MPRDDGRKNTHAMSGGSDAGAMALPYEEALARILAPLRPAGTEAVPLTAALGRALATPVASPIALPLWDNAGMDGYAVHRDDVVGASAASPIALPVTSVVVAGADASALAPLRRGEAARIMTGAPVPPGATAVVRVEDTDREGSTSGTVRITADRDLAGRANIRPRGEEIGVGDVPFPVGTTLSAAGLGVLASLGAATVTVFRRPRVAVLSGGDELALVEDFADVLSGRRIVSSSSYALPPLLAHAGAEVTLRPLVADTRAATTAAIEAALAEGIDLLLTTGGVSVGAHDHVRDALQDAGGTLEFWRARIRPGGPLGAGTVGGIPWLGLPGNPVSTLATGWLFAAPAVRRLGGHSRVAHRTLRVRAGERATTAAPLAHFLRVTLGAPHDGVPVATLAGAQASNLLRTMADADALMRVPEDVQQVEPGMLFDAIPLPGAEWVAG